jgi:hypothetical protein
VLDGAHRPFQLHARTPPPSPPRAAGLVQPPDTATEKYYCLPPDYSACFMLNLAPDTWANQRTRCQQLPGGDLATWDSYQVRARPHPVATPSPHAPHPASRSLLPCLLALTRQVGNGWLQRRMPGPGALTDADARPHLRPPQEQSFVEAAFAQSGSLVAQYWLGLTRSGTTATSSFSSVWEPTKPLASNVYSDAPYYAHW